jgi:hypothetical protein
VNLGNYNPVKKYINIYIGNFKKEPISLSFLVYDSSSSFHVSSFPHLKQKERLREKHREGESEGEIDRRF